MLLYQAGHEDAFNILYRRYAGKVLSFLKKRFNRTDAAQDAFQATFIKLHRSREQFNSSFTFAPWLFTIARTSALDEFKKKNTDAKYFDLRDPNFFSTELSSIEASETMDLSSLPTSQRLAIEMRYLEEKSFEEIASRLETSTANVRQLVSRGVRQLKILFGKNGE